MREETFGFSTKLFLHQFVVKATYIRHLAHVFALAKRKEIPLLILHITANQQRKRTFFHQLECHSTSLLLPLQSSIALMNE